MTDAAKPNLRGIAPSEATLGQRVCWCGLHWEIIGIDHKWRGEFKHVVLERDGGITRNVDDGLGPLLVEDAQ